MTTASYEKLLPQNMEAECGVLGSIIIDPDMYWQVSTKLRATFFYRDAHQKIYEAIETLVARGEKADFITLCDYLESKNTLEDVGGSSYITGLINQVPTSGNASFYAGIVARTALNRFLIWAAGKIAAIGYEDTEEGVSNAQKIMLDITQLMISGADITSVGTVLDSTLIELDRLVEENEQAKLKGEKPLLGVPSGFKDFDRLLKGFQKGHFDVMAARTGIGKSTIAFNIARNAAKKGFKVVMFLLELSKEEVTQRFLSLESGVPFDRLQVGDIYDDEWAHIVDAIGRLKAMSIWFDDSPGLTIPEMRAKLEKQLVTDGVDLVIVDYIQILQSSLHDKRNKAEEIADLCAGLKLRIARDLNLPVFALAQVSRDAERRMSKIPVLSDLSDSSAIEKFADSVTFIYRDEVYNPETERPNVADLHISKHRHGRTGVVSLYLNKEIMHFGNLETTYGEEPA